MKHLKLYEEFTNRYILDRFEVKEKEVVSLLNKLNIPHNVEIDETTKGRRITFFYNNYGYCIHIFSTGYIDDALISFVTDEDIFSIKDIDDLRSKILSITDTSSWMKKINENNKYDHDYIKKELNKKEKDVKDLLDKFKIPYEVNYGDERSEVSILFFMNSILCTVYLYKPHRGNRIEVSFLYGSSDGLPYYPIGIGELESCILSNVDISSWMKKINEGLFDDPEFDSLNSEITSLLTQLRIPHHIEIMTISGSSGKSNISRQISDQQGLEYVDLTMGSHKNSNRNIKFKLNGDDYTIFSFRPEGSTDHKIKFYGKGILVELENIEELRSAILSKVDISSWMKGINENVFDDVQLRNKEKLSDQIKNLLVKLKIPYHMGTIDESMFIFKYNEKSYGIKAEISRGDGELFISLIRDGYLVSKSLNIHELRYNILIEVDISSWMKKINESSFSNNINITTFEVRKILDKYKIKYIEKPYHNSTIRSGRAFIFTDKNRSQHRFSLFIEDEYDDSFRIYFVIDTPDHEETISIHTEEDLEETLLLLVKEDTWKAMKKINESSFMDDTMEESISKIKKILDKFNIDYELEDTLYLYNFSGDDHIIGSKSFFFDFKGDQQEIFIELNDENNIRLGFNKKLGVNGEQYDVFEEKDIIDHLHSLVENETLSAVRKINEEVDGWDLPTEIDDCMDYVKDILSKARIKYKESKSSTSFKFKLKDSEYNIRGEQYINMDDGGHNIVIYITDRNDQVYTDIKGCTNKGEFVVKFLEIYGVYMTDVIKKMNDFD